MNVWLKVQVLVVLFCLSSSAPTPDECRHLLEPLPLDEPSTLVGNWRFIRGYSNYDLYQNILKKTQVSKVEIKAGTNSNELIGVQESKINGTCMGSTSIMTLHGNIGSSTVGNITTSFHMLSACDGCMVFSLNSTASASSINNVLQLMKFQDQASGDHFTATTLYLFYKDLPVEDLNLEMFNKQAQCLGFTHEPEFIYDPKEDDCSKDELVLIEIK